MNTTQKLLSFIQRSTSPFHVVKESISLLQQAGFQELNLTAPWDLKKGSSYYTSLFDSALFAFSIGGQLSNDIELRIGAAHTDHPCFHIKPKAEIIEKDYLKINTETYGGIILHSWLDRPLSIAGKVALKTCDIFHPEIILVDFQKPLLTIPNLAIHMNRQVNQGVELNKQSHMLPIFSMFGDSLNTNTYFLDYLSSYLNITSDQILDFDLYIYNQEPGCILGMEEEFLSSPRLDNLTSVYSLIEGITCGNNPSGINLVALYDNEEVGSQSKQGADSMISNIILEKIFHHLGKSPTDLYNSIMRGVLLSVDVAHGFHPNYPEKNDPGNVTQLGKGVVLKINSSQKYTFDTEAISIIQQLCIANQIPYQKFVNHSNMTSGSTLGSIASSWLPMKTVDLGVPILAMHSAREFMNIQDQKHLSNLLKIFFQK